MQMRWQQMFEFLIKISVVLSYYWHCSAAFLFVVWAVYVWWDEVEPETQFYTWRSLIAECAGTASVWCADLPGWLHQCGAPLPLPQHTMSQHQQPSLHYSGININIRQQFWHWFNAKLVDIFCIKKDMDRSIVYWPYLSLGLKAVCLMAGLVARVEQ